MLSTTIDEVRTYQRLLMRRNRERLRDIQQQGSVSGQTIGPVYGPRLPPSMQSRAWWLNIVNQRPSECIREWRTTCCWCGCLLLQSEAAGWCCSQGKYSLSKLPPYTSDLLDQFTANSKTASDMLRKQNR